MQTKLRWLPSLRLGQLKVFNWVWLRNFIWDLHFISKMQQQRWDQFTPPLEMHTFPIFIFKIQHCHWNQPLFGLFYNFSYQCSAANIHHCLYFFKKSGTIWYQFVRDKRHVGSRWLAKKLLKSRYLLTSERGPWGQLRPLLSNLIVCNPPLTLLMDQKVELVCYSWRS